MLYRTFSLLSTVACGFFILILFFTTQWGRMVLRLLFPFSGSSSWASEGKAQGFFVVFFLGGGFKITHQVYGQAWVWIQFVWLGHSFTYGEHAFIQHVFLPHHLPVMPSAMAMVTAVNTGMCPCVSLSLWGGHWSVLWLWRVVKERCGVLGSNWTRATNLIGVGSGKAYFDYMASKFRPQKNWWGEQGEWQEMGREEDLRQMPEDH